MSWITIAKAAQIYKCSRRTIRRRITMGMLNSKLTNGLRWVWLEEKVNTVSSHKQTILQERYVVSLFEIYEGLCHLRRRFEQPLAMAEWFDRCAPPDSQPQFTHFYQTWNFFFEKMDHCFRQVDTFLDTLHLDHSILLNLYRTLVVLKSQWQESELYRWEEKRDGKVGEYRDTLTLLNHLLEHVRRLLPLCTPESSSETVSHVVVQDEVGNMAQQPGIDCPEDLATSLLVNETVSLDPSKGERHSSSKKINQDKRQETSFLS